MAGRQEGQQTLRFRGLDLNLLVVLDALFETHSVTKAGKRLNLSQSATSSALSRLRLYFDDDLLVATRSPTGAKEMTVTAFGKTLAEPVRFMLAELQATISKPAAFNLATCTDHIRIIAPDFIEMLLLAEVIRRANVLAPLMTFEICGGGTNEDAAIELSRGICDFLIGAPQHLSSGHPSKPLLQDTSVCLGCTSNARLTKTLSQSEFFSLKRIELTKVHGDRRAQADDEEIKFLRSAAPCLKIDSLSLIPSYVRNSELVCLIPQKLAAHFAANWSLQSAKIENFDQTIEFHLQWNRSFTRDPARAWFRDFVICVAEGFEQPAQGFRGTTKENAPVGFGGLER